MSLASNTRHKYTKEEDQFLIDNVKGISEKELIDTFNSHFGLSLNHYQISNRKHKLNITSGVNSGCFKKGHISHNKGKKWSEYMSEEGQNNSLKTCFKKGNIPASHREVGEERTTVDGYIEIKIAEPNRWQLKHRYIYEKEYGKIPDGYNLIFLDGNRKNIELSNLKLISKAQDLIMNKNKLFAKDKNLTNTGTIIAKVIEKTHKKGKSNERNK